VSNLFEQYKANCRQYVRRTPYRLLRLLGAFVAALVLAPICALAARVTGMPAAAVVVGIVGAVGVLVIWIFIERVFQGNTDAEVPSQSPFAAAPAQPGFPPALGFVTPEVVPTSAPAWQSAGPPPAKSGSGCLIPLLVVGGVLMLSCCGGTAALFVVGSRVAERVNNRVAQQREDQFFELRQLQQRQMEEMLRSQEDAFREVNRDLIGQDPSR
jgi:hypothetical protein